jgi:hypothetical protein
MSSKASYKILELATALMAASAAEEARLSVSGMCLL